VVKHLSTFGECWIPEWLDSKKCSNEQSGRIQKQSPSTWNYAD
jgi:hypothetical protein